MREIIIEIPSNFGKTLKAEKVNAEIKGEIVRCKDCKHKEKDGISEGYHYCNINGLQVTDDWFCADGERTE